MRKTWLITTSQQSSLHFYRKHDCSRTNSIWFYSAEMMIVHNKPTSHLFSFWGKHDCSRRANSHRFHPRKKKYGSRRVNRYHLFTTWQAKSLLPFYEKHDCLRQANSHCFQTAKTLLFTTNNQLSLPYCESIIVHDASITIASILQKAWFFTSQ